MRRQLKLHPLGDLIDLVASSRRSFFFFSGCLSGRWGWRLMRFLENLRQIDNLYLNLMINR